MSIEVLSMLLLAAAGAGVLLTLLALGRLRGEAASPEAAAEGPPPPRSRPGSGPCHGWFMPGGGRLGALRFRRYEGVVGALAEDLGEHQDVLLAVGAKKRVLQRLRQMAWPDQEALFLNSPADPFLLLIDRPVERFDPRYDRYLIVPLGFMEAAGGLEAFFGAFAYDVIANKRDPMDTGEALLRDAAEAAMAAGFAPPDVLRSLVQMLRQQVFAGRYRPFVAMPAAGVGSGRPPAPGASSAEPTPGADPVMAPPRQPKGPPSPAGGVPTVTAEPAPLATPVPPQAPPGAKKPKPKK